MKMVRVGANPKYKLPAEPKAGATPDERAAHSALKASWAAVKESRVLTLPYVTAIDNIRNSGGMYAILPETAPASTAAAVRMPEEMSADELKLTALQLGVDMKKPMKKADLISAVRKAMDAMQIVEDDDEDSEVGAD